MYILGFGFHSHNDEDWEVVEIEKHKPYCTHKATALTPTLASTLQTLVDTDTKLIDRQDQCILFRLPAELRLRIYEQALSINSPTVHLKWYPSNYLRPSILSILETCRRINAEAESIFYTINHFQYLTTRPRHATAFSQSLSPVRRNAIRRITISVSSGSEALSQIQELTLLSKLQTLRIERRLDVRYIDIGTWKLLAKQIKMELEKFSGLRELDIFTPDVMVSATSRGRAVEEQRMGQLAQIDALLQGVVSRGSLTSA
jgi:hypothetical protein